MIVTEVVQRVGRMRKMDLFIHFQFTFIPYHDITDVNLQEDAPSVTKGTSVTRCGSSPRIPMLCDMLHGDIRQLRVSESGG